MKNDRALLSQPGQPPNVIEYPDLPDVKQLRWLQDQVGGFVEAIDLLPNVVALINEDGLYNNLPVNQWATHLVRRLRPDVNIMGGIVGPLLVVRTDGSEMVGMTREQAEELILYGGAP